MQQFTWEMFSSRLEERRKEKKYKFSDVERESKMNQVYYRNWEKGKKQPNVLMTFAKLCTFLEADPRYFFGMIDLPDISEPHYHPLNTDEANSIAEITDSISDKFYRERLLILAELEEKLVLHERAVLKEKKEKTINLLGDMLEIGGGDIPDATASQNEAFGNDTKPLSSPINRDLFNWAKFGARLKLRREEKGYTQEDVTKNTGMSRSYYANWEVSRKTPGALTNFLNVCVSLETDPRYLLCLSDEPDPNVPVYISRKYPETNKVAAIVDRLPRYNRERMLSFAKADQLAAETSENVVSDKNRKIIGLLQELIGDNPN